jgi:hypothetical protein
MRLIQLLTLPLSLHLQLLRHPIKPKLAPIGPQRRSDIPTLSNNTFVPSFRPSHRPPLVHGDRILVPPIRGRQDHLEVQLVLGLAEKRDVAEPPFRVEDGCQSACVPGCLSQHRILNCVWFQRHNLAGQRAWEGHSPAASTVTVDEAGEFRRD